MVAELLLGAASLPRRSGSSTLIGTTLMDLVKRSHAP
jgi:hypothetical protein